MPQNNQFKKQQKIPSNNAIKKNTAPNNEQKQQNVQMNEKIKEKMRNNYYIKH